MSSLDSNNCTQMFPITGPSCKLAWKNLSPFLVTEQLQFRNVVGEFPPNPMGITENNFSPLEIGHETLFFRTH